MENSVLACIKSRRSIRRYKEDQISEDQLDLLLEAATWAPSGSNSQSWLFLALQNKGLLVELNTIIKKAFLTWTPDDDYPAKKRAVINSAKENFSFFHNAPTLIIAANVPGYQNGLADCTLALQNIFLMAQSIGLGTCWINQLRWLRDESTVREFLVTIGIPLEYEIFCSAVVGCPAHAPSPFARKEGRTLVVR